MIGFVILVGYLLILILIGTLVQRLFSPLIGRWWRLFVAPGVIVHELAHALGCVLTGADIHEINFWKASGGHVIHTQSRLHLLGPVVIAFAPTIVMTLGLLILIPLLTPETLLPWTDDLPQGIGSIGEYFQSLGLLIQQFNWTSVVPWLITYGMLNAAVTITPSAQDWRNARWAFLGLVIILAFAQAVFGLAIDPVAVWHPVATSLLFLSLAVLASLLAWIVLVLIKKKA